MNQSNSQEELKQKLKLGDFFRSFKEKAYKIKDLPLKNDEEEFNQQQELLQKEKLQKQEQQRIQELEQKQKAVNADLNLLKAEQNITENCDILGRERGYCEECSYEKCPFYIFQPDGLANQLNCLRCGCPMNSHFQINSEVRMDKYYGHFINQKLDINRINFWSFVAIIRLEQKKSVQVLVRNIRHKSFKIINYKRIHQNDYALLVLDIFQQDCKTSILSFRDTFYANNNMRAEMLQISRNKNEYIQNVIEYFPQYFRVQTVAAFELNIKLLGSTSVNNQLNALIDKLEYNNFNIVCSSKNQDYDFDRIELDNFLKEIFVDRSDIQQNINQLILNGQFTMCLASKVGSSQFINNNLSDSYMVIDDYFSLDCVYEQFYRQMKSNQRVLLVLRPYLDNRQIESIISNILKINDFVLINVIFINKRQKISVQLNIQQCNFLAQIEEIDQNQMQEYNQLMTDGVTNLLLFSKIGGIDICRTLVDSFSKQTPLSNQTDYQQVFENLKFMIDDTKHSKFFNYFIYSPQTETKSEILIEYFMDKQYSQMQIVFLGFYSYVNEEGIKKVREIFQDYQFKVVYENFLEFNNQDIQKYGLRGYYKAIGDDDSKYKFIAIIKPGALHEIQGLMELNYSISNNTFILKEDKIVLDKISKYFYNKDMKISDLNLIEQKSIVKYLFYLFYGIDINQIEQKVYYGYIEFIKKQYYHLDFYQDSQFDNAQKHITQKLNKMFQKNKDEKDFHKHQVDYFQVESELMKNFELRVFDFEENLSLEPSYSRQHKSEQEMKDYQSNIVNISFSNDVINVEDNFKLQSWYYHHLSQIDIKKVPISYHYKKIGNRYFDVQQSESIILIESLIKQLNKYYINILDRKIYQFHKTNTYSKRQIGSDIQDFQETYIEEVLTHLWGNKLIEICNQLSIKSQIRGIDRLLLRNNNNNIEGIFVQNAKQQERIKYEQIIRDIGKNYDVIQDKNITLMDQVEKESFLYQQKTQISKLNSMLNFIFNSQEYDYLRKDEHKRIIPFMLKHSNIRIYEDKDEKLFQSIYNYNQNGLLDKFEAMLKEQGNSGNLDQNQKGYEDLQMQWDRYFQKEFPYNEIQMCYIVPCLKSKYYFLANIVYLFDIELLINEQGYQNMKDRVGQAEFRYNKIKQIRKGFKKCFTNIIKHDEEDVQYLQQLYMMSQQKMMQGVNYEKISEEILDLVKIELFLICLDKLHSMLNEMNDLQKIYQQKQAKQKRLEKSNNLSDYQYLQVYQEMQNNLSQKQSKIQIELEEIKQEVNYQLKQIHYKQEETMNLLNYITNDLDLFYNFGHFLRQVRRQQLDQQYEMKGNQQSQKTQEEWEFDLKDLEDGYDFVAKPRYFIPFVNQNQLSTTIGNEMYIVKRGAEEKEQMMKSIRNNPQSVLTKNWQNDDLQKLWVDRQLLKINYLRKGQKYSLGDGVYPVKYKNITMDELEQAYQNEVERYNKTIKK